MIKLLTHEQEKAKSLLGKERVTVLTGGPGTGKTTTLAAWAKDLSPFDTLYCAPTGRAAQRMSEAFAEAGLKGVHGLTVHSALVPDRGGKDKNGWTFHHNKYNRLPFSTVIVDEFSMMDNSIFNSLVQALNTHAKLIVIGDPDQLPPVGPGAGLRDLIRCRWIPHAHLTQIHRFAGRVAHVCRAINKGTDWSPSPKLDMSPDAGEFGPENFKHCERRNAAECLSTLDELVGRIKQRGFDPMTQLQVICSRNEQGPLNRLILNERLQKLLNPDGQGHDKCPYRVGDKIMCLLNGTRDTFAYVKSGSGFIWEKTDETIYISNGEIGICCGVEEKEVFVNFGSEKKYAVKFTPGMYETQITLAYAITTHKSQGGGWPIVIYMIDHSFNVDRSLIYTAISRTKQMCFTVGSMQTLRQQCKKVAIVKRKTLLPELIDSMMDIV